MGMGTAAWDDCLGWDLGVGCSFEDGRLFPVLEDTWKVLWMNLSLPSALAATPGLLSPAESNQELTLELERVPALRL